MIDETHDPQLRSWVASAAGHADFTIQNLPFGVFQRTGEDPRGGVAIGELIVDLSALARSDLLQGPAQSAAQAGGQATLNALLALPGDARLALRRSLSTLLCDVTKRAQVEPLLLEAEDCELPLPVAIGDYTDFYAGIHHARNVGQLFRPDQPLLPNYKYVPIGYHGRSSSVCGSGTLIVRPTGQRKLPNIEEPVFGPSERLDIELELGIWITGGNAMGASIAIGDAGAHIAGLSLLNDWSARDLQAWEYQPLGPFLAKSFQTSVSPWIVTAEALAPFRIAQPPRPVGDPAPLPYLSDHADQRGGAYAIDLEVSLLTPTMRAAGDEAAPISRSAACHLYWTAAQLVAHHSSNGCNLRSGDLLGTGTISTPDDSGLGSLLEMTRGGSVPVTLPNGEQRRFLEDGDEITLTGHARADGRIPIGFGACRGTIAPATDR